MPEESIMRQEHQMDRYKSPKGQQVQSEELAIWDFKGNLDLNRKQ